MVSSFLQHRNQVLLLRRSQRVGTFRGRWAAVSGYLPDGVDSLEQALLEISEETGLGVDQVVLLRRGEPLLVADEGGGQWLVHPFLFSVQDPACIRLDWEHTEARWVDPGDIVSFDTVPGLPEVWERVCTPS
ncbi:MAG: NUDIX pyrophosphatase [Chloroflexi bacterium]|nr:NUDIX pyrophosphatase [Chloroflexota bacterium]